MLNIDVAELRGCCERTISVHRRSSAVLDSADSANPFVAIKEKFAHPTWHSVSLISPVGAVTWC